MNGAPPPPPPHGEAPKTAPGSGLPPGKYDIFIIPEHSAGSGFLYLPSLRPNINSFVAGFASALVLVVLGQSMAPAFQAWWANFQGMGSMGMMMLVIAVGLGAWSLGRTQQDGTGPGGSGPSSGSNSPGGGFGSSSSRTNTGAPPPHSPPPQPETPQSEKPKPSWQRPPPQPGTTRAETPKGAWEKAREETRRKEEERKAQETERIRKEAAAQRLKELREKEARERAQRDKEKLEKEAKDREEREKKEQREKELKEQQERDQRAKELRERLEKEKAQRDRIKREEDEKRSRQGSTYAYSAVGERTNPWPNGKPPAAASSQPTPPSSAARPPSPSKKPPAPTANTYLGTDEDAYSFRPYDKPKRPARRKSQSDFSEASWAPSQSTAKTTPPASVRAPYTTKDPDKIVVKAVYGFLNQFAKTPSSQLISGIGSVTDGLILRITTEGLFIDDDVRGVAQREWDVKAWTLKLVEVWCPSHSAALANSGANNETLKSSGANAANNNASAFLRKTTTAWRSGAAGRGEPKPLVDEAADAYLADMLRECKGTCRLGLCDGASAYCASSATASSATSSSGANHKSWAEQTGEWKSKNLHLLRATVRDQEGKRYLFVLHDEEAWKVAMGLQRLRKGTQVRSLGVAGMSGLETRSVLEVLGWGGS